jgi:hypothetical protein
MKKNLIFSLLLCFTGILSAQTVAKKANAVKQEIKTMSQGVKNAFVIEIPNAKPDFVEDKWKGLLDSYKAKPKWNRKEKEYFSDNAQMTEINGNNPVDVYAKIEESGTNNTLLTVWFDLGGAYLNATDHSEKSAFGEKIIAQFTKDVALAATQKEIDEEEKKFKKQESKLKNTVGDKEDLLKNIENYKAKIKKAEDDIIKNEQSQKEQQKAIEDQREVIKKAQKKLEEISKA